MLRLRVQPWPWRRQVLREGLDKSLGSDEVTGAPQTHPEQRRRARHHGYRRRGDYLDLRLSLCGHCRIGPRGGFSG